MKMRARETRMAMRLWADFWKYTFTLVKPIKRNPVMETRKEKM